MIEMVYGNAPLHPVAVKMLATLKENSVPEWQTLSPLRGREMYDARVSLFADKRTATGHVDDRVIDGQGGNLRVRCSRRNTSLSLPVAMHDYTGPFTLLAGLHSALSAPNLIYQESVRAYLPTCLVCRPGHHGERGVRNGRILPPEAPGVGAQFKMEIFEYSDGNVTPSRVSD
jgi:hypothetical protein